MSKVRVEVTEEDIRQGKPRNSDKCPIVAALRRRFKAWRIIKVHKDEVYFARRSDDAGQWKTLPEEVVVFMSHFNWEGKEAVKPFTFEITAPMK